MRHPAHAPETRCVASCCLLAVFTWALGGNVASAARYSIEPGPTTMSEAEKALEPDPEAGAQHGVILLEETLRDENRTERLVAYHLRAKILSNEARELADIAIPFDSEAGTLLKWWGHTIHPDGRTFELDRKDLQEQFVAGIRTTESHVLKAALPGVVPGCVIDYGYTFVIDRFERWSWINLQHRWPVRQLRYEWIPNLYRSNQYFVRRQPEIRMEVRKEKDSVIIEGWDLPAFVHEEWAPPDDVLRAGAALFYTRRHPTNSPEAFWNSVAKDRRVELGTFLKKKKTLRNLLSEMSLPEDAPLEDRLEVIYEWVEENIEDRALQGAEDVERTREEDESKDLLKMSYAAREKEDTAEALLERGYGWRHQILELFIGLAREAGARADIVMAADRDEHLWDRTLLTESPLEWEVAVIEDPDAPGGPSVFAAPGSGLPFGMLPYWLTLIRALRVSPDGGREIFLPISKPQESVMETRATITFDADGPARVGWSAHGTGHEGYLQRITMRRAPPETRGELLDAACGAGGALEITEAKLLDPEDPVADFRIECEGDLLDMRIDDEEYGLIMEFGGPWIPGLPAFASTTRQHPIIFPFPSIHMSTIEMDTPEGFAPGDLPDEVLLQSPYGSYRLRFGRSDRGIRVERAVALTALTVDVDDYQELRSFIQEVRITDRTPVIFRRDESAD